MLVTYVALHESREGRIFSNEVPFLIQTLTRIQWPRRPDVLKKEAMRRKQAIWMELPYSRNRMEQQFHEIHR